MSEQTLWIIGGSSGIGLSLVALCLKKGHRVIASAPNTQNSKELNDLKGEYLGSLHLVDIDATQTQSVKEATQRAWSIYGGIDVALYNAGIYEKMGVDALSFKSVSAICEVNYLGAVRFLTQIVPLFKKQGRGHIAFNVSISSYFGLPFGGAYSAPKAALLNFCESIKPELMRENIHLQVINHGFVKTRLTQKNDFYMPQLLEPDEAAQRIYEGLQRPQKFEIKFPWLLTRLIGVLRVLPYNLAFKITKKAV